MFDSCNTLVEYNIKITVKEQFLILRLQYKWEEDSLKMLNVLMLKLDTISANVEWNCQSELGKSLSFYGSLLIR